MDSQYKKALAFDKDDILYKFKHEFVQDPNLIYLDGNSLGKLPKKSIKATSELVEKQWGDRLIRSWNEHWIDLPGKIEKKLATLLGVDADEIFVGDSTSLNLYKLAFAILNNQTGKNQILSDTFNFPSDLYVIQGLINNQFKGHTLELINSTFNQQTNINLFKEKLSKKTSLITLSHVAYKTSFMYDLKSINDLAKKHKSFVIWDLSHSIGAVPINLRTTNSELAIGCTYKYLNGGPGASAFLYVKKELQEQLTNPIWSWFAHSKPFDFDMNFESTNSIKKFSISTPNILSLAPVECGLDLILQAGIQNIREKSLNQSRFLIDLIEELLVPLGFQIASPLKSDSIGSHISIQHKDAYRINRALIEPINHKTVIIPDFRPPNNIRLGIAPLYTSFIDLYAAIKRIEAIIKSKEYERFSKIKLTVT